MKLPYPSLSPSVRTNWCCAAIFFVLLSLTGHVAAGVFSVTPVRIYMGPRDRAVAVTITNEGDTPIALQADLNTWSQKPDGTDELVLTEDMILSPPIIKLAPRARQVVRLALVKPADASRQLTYRFILREVPEVGAPKEGQIQLPISLALSMPVFVTPPIAKREMECTANKDSTQTVQAVCRNTGTAYAQVREILVQRGGQTVVRFEGGSYVLPGAQKAIPIKSDTAVAAGPANMQVTFDDGKTQTFSITLP